MICFEHKLIVYIRIQKVWKKILTTFEVLIVTFFYSIIMLINFGCVFCSCCFVVVVVWLFVFFGCAWDIAHMKKSPLHMKEWKKISISSAVADLIAGRGLYHVTSTVTQCFRFFSICSEILPNLGSFYDKQRVPGTFSTGTPWNPPVSVDHIKW